MELFREFWWLIFPVLGMFYGLVGMLQQNRARSRAIDVIRAYAEQGKDPPPEVLKALTQNDPPASASAYSGPLASAWWTFLVFFALSAGFGIGYIQLAGDARWAFMLVTVVMGVLALGALVMAIVATFNAMQRKH